VADAYSRHGLMIVRGGAQPSDCGDCLATGGVVADCGLVNALNINVRALGHRIICPERELVIFRATGAYTTAVWAPSPFV